METINITNTKAKITADEPTVLSFDKARSYIHIRNDSSDTAYAALGAVEELTDTEDGVISVPAGGSTRLDAELPPLPPVICTVKGSVSVILSNADSCPFKTASGGGDTPIPTPTSGGKIELTPLYDGEIPTSGSSVVEITITADTDILQICPRCLGANNSTVGYVQTVCVPISKLSAEEMQLTVYSYISSTSRMGNFLVSLDGNKVKIRASHTWLNYAVIYGQRIVEPDYNAQLDYLIQYGMVYCVTQ